VQVAYELDSPMYFLRLLHSLFQAAPAAPGLHSSAIHTACKLVVELLQRETLHDDRSPYRSKELARGGLGPPVKPGINLTWSGFRPSDDKCELGYHIPANLFAVVSLHQLGVIAPVLWGDAKLAADAARLSVAIKQAVAMHGTTTIAGHGKIYCYEVDGLGGCNTLDDANIPSLLALPYLDKDTVGYDPAVYAATRKWVLSAANPQYFHGTKLSGVGSPHTPTKMAWPMALAVAALTSTSTTDRLALLATLIDTDGNTGYIHEAVNVNDPGHYSRPWFEWANVRCSSLSSSQHPLATIFPAVV
jgi:meiotically up-regulated gene 157 (Mug157) protein